MTTVQWKAWLPAVHPRVLAFALYSFASAFAVLLHLTFAGFHERLLFEIAEDAGFFVIGGVVLWIVLRAGVRSVEVSENALRESEARYRSLVRSLDDFVFTADTNQRFTGVFGAWAERHGLAPSSLIGYTPAQVFGEAAAPRHDAAFWRVLRGTSAEYQWQAQLGGRTLYFRTTISPLRNDEDLVVGAVGVTRDVTEATALDDAYQHTAELLHAVIAGSPVAIFMLDAEGRIRSANPAAETILGKTQASLLGELLVRPAESADVARRLRECAADGMSFTGIEVERWRDDGTRAVLALSAAPINGRNGTARAVVALAMDVTARRRADEALSRYRVMAEQVRDIILFAGSDGRVIDANDAALEAYGYTREELTGLPLARVTGGSGEHGEMEHVRKDGSCFPVEVSAAGAESDGQRFEVILARDITQRQRRQAFERLLHEIDRRILQNQPVDAVLTFTCEQIAALYGYALVQLSIRGESGVVTIRKGAGPAIDFLDELEVRWDDSVAGRGPTGTAIRTGQVQLRDLASDPGFEPWRERALARGLRSAIALPLVAHDRVLGALTLFTAEDAQIDADSMNLLVMFADQIALSLLAAQDQEQIALQTVALESAANAVVVTDLTGTIRWVNPAFVQLTGFSFEESVGSKPSLLKSGNHSDAFYRQMWETVMHGSVWTGELYNRRKDGTLYVEEQTITPVRDANGCVTHFVAIKQDITARKRHEEQIRYLAMHDALTDLPNRRALDGAMERLAWDARRGTAGAVLMVDVDNFKPVNDTLGHVGGDQILAELARLFCSALRPGDFLARLGGDEFAVLLQDTTLDNARITADRLRSAVAEHRFRFGERIFDLTISVGIAPLDAASDGPSAMVLADSAMYAAKAQGKNRVVGYPYGEGEGLRLIEASRWASRIKSALAEERFVLCFQPVVRLGSNEPQHYEALIRMIEPTGETIPPDDFISAAERFGLMPQIDRWVVDHVVQRIESGEMTVRLFVNVSGASLGDAALLDFIERRIIEANIPAGMLAFEITESAAVRDLAAAQSWIRKLKDLGCLFAIDDFGVGFSSFSYLRALSADYVKIDRSFVSDLDTNPTNRALVQAVKTVAQTLGKEVIAEGVETDAHAAVLLDLGIELGQGYRWGAPRADVFGRG